MKMLSFLKHLSINLAPATKDNCKYSAETKHLQKIIDSWSRVESTCNYYNTPLAITTTEWREDEILRNPRYKNIKITYNCDNRGFRLYGAESSSNIIACFGCSNTFGVGLPDYETWPYLFWQQMRKETYSIENYGVEGASMDTIARLIHNYLGQKKPKIIACLFPEITRKEFFSNSVEELVNFTVKSKDKIITEEEHDNICKTTDFHNGLINFIKNFKLIELLCKVHNVKLLWHTWSPVLLDIKIQALKDFLQTETIMIENKNKLLDIEEINGMRTNTLEKARDGYHFGYKFQKILAENFVNVHRQLILK